ncbi:MAG: hypothetical protein ACXVH3_37930 [Solirubrobacteraceae bacterium]
MRSKAPTKPTASSTTHIAADTAPRIPPPTMARAQMAVRARATRARATSDEAALERDRNTALSTSSDVSSIWSVRAAARPAATY